MSVRAVKNSMHKLNAQISSTLNSVNNLISILNGPTGNTIDLVPSASNRLKANLSVLESNAKTLHKMTADELHIFFREYNTLLSKTIVETSRMKTMLDVLVSDSKMVYILFTLLIFMTGVFRQANSTSISIRVVTKEKWIGPNLKRHIPKLVRFREKLVKLQSATTVNNNKLIIKNNRG